MREFSASKPFLAFVVLAAVVLLFANLGDIYLWQDEAETALLARNVMTHGYPNAWDGKNLITQNAGLDSDEGHRPGGSTFLSPGTVLRGATCAPGKVLLTGAV